MQDSRVYDMQAYFREAIKASQIFAQNYFENLTGYLHDERDIATTYSHLVTKLLANPMEFAKVQGMYMGYLNSQWELTKRTLVRPLIPSKEHKPVVLSEKADKRFVAPEWDEFPYCFDFLKQNYLLFSKLATGIVEEVEIEERTKKKLNFYTRHFIDSFSPSNFFLTNPEAIKLALETKGASVQAGLMNFFEDVEKGRISQTDESAFEVGKNIAITPGAVVFENELIQLIKYTPSTNKVNEIPLLIIPPWINKYYILDLQPKNSFVRFLVDCGITVFMISWRNPTPDKGYLTFDNYVEMGALKAIDVVKSISGSKKVNMLGYCLGGTLLGVVLAVLAEKHSKTKEENPVQTATFLAAMIDFSDVGPMGAVIDQALVKKLERGELTRQGVMHGHDMERAFNLIRANDLVWNYVVNNYLKGNKPTAFDVLFWTNDNTNLPATMYLYYLRNMVLENKLSKKNALRICETQIDISKIDLPVIVIGMKDDHISPCITAFTTTELVSGPVEFILAGSGHVMGVANPPEKKKYAYYLNGELKKGYAVWKKTSQKFEGSWWTPWSERLLKNSGKIIPATEIPGNTTFQVLEPAPGFYVKEKCITCFPKEI